MIRALVYAFLLALAVNVALCFIALTIYYIYDLKVNQRRSKIETFTQGDFK